MRRDLNLCAFNFNVYSTGCIIESHSNKNFVILLHHGDYMIFGISMQSYHSYRNIVCKYSRLQKISLISIVIMRQQIFNFVILDVITCQIIKSIWDISLTAWHPSHSYCLLKLITQSVFLPKADNSGKHSISFRMMSINTMSDHIRFEKETLSLK